MSKYKDIEAKAKDYYFNKWRGNEKVIPAFGEVIYITKTGWNHIVHHPRRTLLDKIIRLKKLELAKQVLETSTHYQTLEIRGEFYYYGFQAIVDDTRVKVIVTSKGKNGKKILFSVMFKSISKQQQTIINKQNDKLIQEFRRLNPKIVPRRRN